MHRTSAGSARLEFAAESERARNENFLLVRSRYRHRFGSLVRAYQLIGYTPEIDYAYVEINRQLRKQHPAVIDSVLQRLREIGPGQDAGW